ncbi:lipid-A-disaccharide synthase [Thermatribacter velox]|uniref:Lipid-A-disaccharide synthase n=1 Tax=Thermatribacter velox TaxID=3039681 RepID=A0ABZ2YD94_9BACT
MKAFPSNATVFVSTGEVSGDRYASLVIESLHKIYPELSVVALGGEALRAAGALLLGDTQCMATVGIWEALRSLSGWWSLFRKTTRYLLSARPRCVLLVDNPGFNLRLARFCYTQGLPVVYFVPPQVWVWGQGRAKKLSRWASSICTIFPWEEAYFDPKKALWVGHPVAWFVEQFEKKQESQEKRDRKTVLLLPGSRTGEVEAYLERVFPALQVLTEKYPYLVWKLVTASSEIQSVVDEKLQSLPVTLVAHQELYHVAQEALFSISCSGTITLEMALLGVPQIIVYRVSGLTYRLAKLLVKSSWVGLPNILAQEEIFPELIQDDFGPERLIQEVEKFLNEGKKREEQAKLWSRKLREQLCRGNPFENVAQVVKRYL